MHSHKPSVSIVVPVHNEEKHLRDTLESLVRQTYQDWFAYIFENCSTDKSMEIAKEFESNYPGKFSIHPTETLIPGFSNLSRAYTHGIESKYFCWMGGHDQWEPNFLAACVQAMDRDLSISLCFPRGIWINENGHAESLIPGFFDTRGLSPKDRIGTVLNSTPYAFQIYGLHRWEVLKSIWNTNKSPTNIVGPDVVNLCQIAKVGNIVGIDSPGSFIKMRKCHDYGDWNAYFSKLNLKSEDALSIFWDTINAFHESTKADGARSPINESILILERFLWGLQSFMPALSKGGHLQDPKIQAVLQVASAMASRFNEALGCFPQQNQPKS